jgi:hypothetical protein
MLIGRPACIFSCPKIPGELPPETLPGAVESSLDGLYRTPRDCGDRGMGESLIFAQDDNFAQVGGKR